MTENGSHQLVVKARFQFKQTNEDELTINKGDIIYVTRTEEGGWWEGTLNGKTGWFPSNYVREIKSSGKTFGVIIPIIVEVYIQVCCCDGICLDIFVFHAQIGL